MDVEKLDGGLSALTEVLGVNAEKLVDLLLDQPWHKGCEIINGYMPPYPRPETQPTVVVRCAAMGAFLRYSHGPLQEYFWDIYGDDMHSVEIAILALSRAPAPRNCNPVTFTVPMRSPNAICTPFSSQFLLP